MNLYADIVLPLAQPAYTYAIPEGMTLEAGDAVSVQFGLKKYYTGLVWRVHENPPAVKRVKRVVRKVYDRPLLDARQRALWEWIASYYLCTLGEVMRCALPSLIKPSAETDSQLLDDTFYPRTERYYALAASYADSAQLNETFDRFERRAPRLYEALLEVVSALENKPDGEVARRLLTADATPLQTLVKKGILTMTEHTPEVEYGTPQFRLPTLTPHQQEALAKLKADFKAGRTTALLHGITGSGKTEIYIHLIAEVLKEGGDVLLMVPEIALTAQLIERMERIFGSRVTAYHSRLTNHRRSETYLRLNRSLGGEFVVGVRSSIFLPLKRLQLIIVDEEHDASYKQAEPAPRYSARDVAVWMAHQTAGRTILGSATPSLESWLHAASGKYGKAKLTERYGDAELPKIYLSDTRRAAQRGERHGHFNKLLIDKIEATLARGEQVMLFQNRRGFAPYLECPQCGWTARCPHCNVTLSYHKVREQLVCHYCGHTEAAMVRCPSCKVVDLQPMGFGTEKIEEQISELFPEARVGRLDRDQLTSETAFNRIVDDFAAHRTDILVGTQMITKGFDFEDVSLVGVLNADNLLLNPDFRASERAFQLLQQVSGRAGRRRAGGEVVIQTADPAHPVLRQLLNDDFEQMARDQLAERQAYFYPPYARLTMVTLRHPQVQIVRRAAAELADRLRRDMGRRVLGPIAPPVDRIRGEYLMQLMLKVESGASRLKANELLREKLQQLQQLPDYKSVTISVNVDPQ
ncbi:MAG: primosomal protein N' [Rikenellaceae bacterium]|nr:primosomal protein N' [Rikenellaceae bacterium]